MYFIQLKHLNKFKLNVNPVNLPASRNSKSNFPLYSATWVNLHYGNELYSQMFTFYNKTSLAGTQGCWLWCMTFVNQRGIKLVNKRSLSLFFSKIPDRSLLTGFLYILRQKANVAFVDWSWAFNAVVDETQHVQIFFAQKRLQQIMVYLKRI